MAAWVPREGDAVSRRIRSAARAALVLMSWAAGGCRCAPPRSAWPAIGRLHPESRVGRDVGRGIYFGEIVGGKNCDRLLVLMDGRGGYRLYLQTLFVGESSDEPVALYSRGWAMRGGGKTFVLFDVERQGVTGAFAPATLTKGVRAATC